MKLTVFSGIQPTGDIHIGNYIGAISNWVNYQNDTTYNNIYCIVDLHAITLLQDPSVLRENTLSMVATLLACGINTDKSILFLQSHNIFHAELSWILSCVAKIGWLSRMTQFKDKSGDNKEKSSVGLYAYPCLQAADILLYNTDLVPVGEDQKQHIELCRDIATKFNKDYKQDIFKLPKPYIVKDSARIMSLVNPNNKMSKSDPSDYAKILLSDSNDMIRKKIMKATTDSLPIVSKSADALEERAALNNLVNIFAFFTNRNKDGIIADWSFGGFADFKSVLADALIDVLSPIRDKKNYLLQNKDYLLDVLKNNAQKVLSISESKMKLVREAVGFLIK